MNVRKWCPVFVYRQGVWLRTRQDYMSCDRLAGPQVPLWSVGEAWRVPLDDNKHVKLISPCRGAD